MAATDAPEPTVNTRTLTRLIIVLIALWSLLEGIVLVGFHGASSGALGAGVTDEAGQRLVGAHLLVLAPAYLLIALRSQLYKTLIWLPFAGQMALVLAVGYSILTGETDFGDGILSVAVSAIFAGLLAYAWVNQQRSVAQAKLDADDVAMRRSDEMTGEEP